MTTIKPLYLPPSGVITQSTPTDEIDIAYLPLPAGSVVYGFTTINFGTGQGSNEATATVTGLSSIAGTSIVTVWIAGDDSTTDHTQSDHRYVAELASFAAANIVSGVGFTVYGTSLQKLTKTFKVRYSYTLG